MKTLKANFQNAFKVALVVAVFAFSGNANASAPQALTGGFSWYNYFFGTTGTSTSTSTSTISSGNTYASASASATGGSTFTFTTVNIKQFPGSPKKSIPLDGGLSILALGAAAFGVRKLRAKKGEAI